MNTPNTNHKLMHAIALNSPGSVGGELKDQDRVVWYPGSQVAVVADGVSSSPHAAIAAEHAATYGPAFFCGDAKTRVRFFADLLVACRREAQARGVQLPPGTPDAMRAMLKDVAIEGMNQAYQTTMIAACFTSSDSGVIVDLIGCGDSAFFAFTPDGDLLQSLPTFEKEQSKNSHDSSDLNWGAGAVVMTRKVTKLSDRPGLVDALGLSQGIAHRWWICEPIDQVELPTVSSDAIAVDRSTQLIVPNHLMETVDDTYHRVRYSKTIKVVGLPPSIPSFTQTGVVTAVLPDHASSSRCVYQQDRFDFDTHFVLCSDGFYEAFYDTKAMWEWLNANALGLQESERANQLLDQLHSKLRATRGDDDISMIWVRPQSQDEGDESDGN